MPRQRQKKDKKLSSSEPQLPLDLSRRQVHYHFAADPESSPTSSRRSSQLRLQHSKHTLIRDLSAQMAHKIRTDDYHAALLERKQNVQAEKMRRIQEEISRINRQNEQQLQVLEKMEKGILRKMEKAIIKQKQEEEALLKEYQKVVAEHKKIQLTRQVKKIRQQEDWVQLQKQQRQLSLKVKHQEQLQKKIIRSSSLDFTKKKEQIQPPKKQKKKSKQQVKEQSDDKNKKRRKNAEELREMGRNYLQHAKRIQAERLLANIKQLDVSRKTIDYLPEIKTIIRMNVQDLSNPMQNTIQSFDPRKRRRVRVIRQGVSPKN